MLAFIQTPVASTRWAIEPFLTAMQIIVLINGLLYVLGVGTAIGCVAAWLFQKSRERRDVIARRKRELLESLLASVMRLPLEDETPFFVESQFAWLYASDHVLSEIYAYSAALARKDTPKKDLEEMLGRILLAMRRDLGVESAIDTHWIKSRTLAVTANREGLEAYLVNRISAAITKSKPDMK